MTLLFIFYWIICGFVMFGLHTGSKPVPGGDLGDFILSMLLGGFFIPAAIVAKMLR